MQFKNQNKLKAFTLSYDDGITQDIRLIEMLAKYNLKCTFNLNSQLLGTKGILIRNDKRIAHYKIHPEDVKYVYDGHEVAVHTLTHPTLTMLDNDEVVRQVEVDRQRLSELTGYEVFGMAYPNGPYDDRVVELLRSRTGVKYSRTVECTGDFEPQSELLAFKPTAYHLEGFNHLMELAKRFVELETDRPQIFYLWGHTYEMDYEEDYWVKLEELFKFISGRDDIFYGTNSEVLL